MAHQTASRARAKTKKAWAPTIQDMDNLNVNKGGNKSCLGRWEYSKKRPRGPLESLPRR